MSDHHAHSLPSPEFPKLFIPGPVQVSSSTLQAFATPLMGHRTEAFQRLYQAIHAPLQQLFGTQQPIFLSTSSAWGVMEGAIRNLVKNKVLNCMCGAFSDKWLDVSQRCGKKTAALQVAWGQPILPEALEARLKQGDIDAVTIIHNETSCGVRNPLSELAEVLRRYPDVISIVDIVSSFSTESLPFDTLGFDLFLTGSQKALALPPGFSLFCVSPKAWNRISEIPNRGYYFDFLEFQKQQATWMTPTTPSIAHLHALNFKLQEILQEGLETRFARHARLNQKLHAWGERWGFENFAAPPYRSLSLSCFSNTRNIPIASWIHDLCQKYHYLIDGGYGPLKGKTFRISNMGDETDESLDLLIAALEDTLQRWIHRC